MHTVLSVIDVGRVGESCRFDCNPEAEAMLWAESLKTTGIDAYFG